MNDMTIIRLIKRLDAEYASNLVKGVEYAVSNEGLKLRRHTMPNIRKKKVTDIFLMSMTPEELTELRTIIKLERKKYWQKGFDKSMPTPGDLKSWMYRLDIRELSVENSIKDIRSISSDALKGYLKEYIYDSYKDKPSIRNAYMRWMLKNNL